MELLLPVRTSLRGQATGPELLLTMLVQTTETPLERQLKHLNSQMSQLVTNLDTLNKNVDTMCTQYRSIEELGVIHASLFMAGVKVYEHNLDDNGGNNEANDDD